MEAFEIASMCNGVRLAAAGNLKLADTNFRTSKKDGKSPKWLIQLVQNEEDLRIFAVMAAWNNFYHKDYIEEKCVPEFLDWKERFYKPSRILEELYLDDKDVLSTILKDSNTGPALLGMVKTGKVHFVSFCYLDAITKCSSSWKGLHYKIVKNKFEMLKLAMPLEKPYVSNFANYLKEKWTVGIDNTT